MCIDHCTHIFLLSCPMYCTVYLLYHPAENHLRQEKEVLRRKMAELEEEMGLLDTHLDASSSKHKEVRVRMM
mgnify:CR=1 FL=1